MGAACAARGRVGRKWDDAEVLSGVGAARGVRISKVLGYQGGVCCLFTWDRFTSRLCRSVGSFGCEDDVVHRNRSTPDHAD